MKMMKTLMLLATVLLSACAGAATPETATGSSAYFHVNTSNDTVRITDVWSKFFEGEYGKGKGRNATFLNGVPVEMDLTIYTENAKNEEDPIDHCEIVSTGERIEMVDQELAQFRIDVGEFEIGEKLEIKAVTREGSESKPFRVNFDIAKIPDCFAHEPAASVEDDRVLYTQLEAGSYWFFQSMDGALKLKDLMRKSNWVDGLKFNWYPQIHLGVAMDSSTAKVLVGTLSGLGGKAVGNISKDNWKKFGKQKIGRLAGVDLHVNLEGDIIGKWNPEKKIWVNVESVIGADIVYSGQVSFRFPQTLYLVYVSGGLSGETHCLISPRSDDQWKLTSNILGQPLIEGFVEGGAGIDGFKVAAGGELGLILHSQNPDMSDWTKGLQDWGWGGQFYWTAQQFGKTWGSQGVRQDETSMDEASYYFQYWWWHNGVHVDSWSSDEAADAAVQSASGPTKANAAKLMAARPRLMAAAEPEPCNPRPALAMRGGVDALLYLTNSPARAASDQSMLLCRTGADGSWGTVETPWDDGTADLSPSVGVADDGTVVAAWVNLKGPVGEPTQLTDVTRQMEIAVGVRNPSTGVWTCRNLTADDQVDFSPRVAVAADGTAYVAWCANSDNAFYGSNTVVKCVKFTGGAWGSVVSLGKVGSVNGLAVACRDAKGAIACTVEDGEAHQVRCFEVSDGSVVQSATVVGTSWVENPDVFYSVDGVARFHWLQEGELRTKGGFAADDDVVAEGAAGVTVPHDAVYLKGPDGVQGLVWQETPKANGEQNGVMLMARDASGKWQVPATLWIPEERNSAFSGGYAADGTLRFAYECASGSRDAQGVMRYGAATLKTFELGAGVDVSVTANEIGVDGERVFFGEENDFVATIHNLGRTDAVNVPVKCVAVANGATNEFSSTVADIAAGGCVCLTSKWTVAEGYADIVLKVLLDPEETLADANRANNVAEWRPKAGVLAIVDERSVRETRTVCKVNAKVVTDGALVVQEGTVVEYRRGGADGELLATDTLGEIVPGKGYSTGFRWDMSATTFAKAWETVYLKIRGCDHAIAAVDVVTTLDTDGDGVFDGEEGLLGSDPNDPKSKPDAWDEPEPSGLGTFRFDSDGVVVNEGETLKVTVSGGNSELASSVQVLATYNTAAAADLDLKNATVNDVKPKSFKFPATFEWAKGEIGDQTIEIPVVADKSVEADEFLTLQLQNPMNLAIGEASACTVTIRGPGQPVVGKSYVRALANDATRGKVTGSALAADGKNVSLKASANKGWTFAGWYTDPACTAGQELTGYGDYRNPSLSYPNTNGAVTVYARFITPEEDGLELGADFLPAEFAVNEEVSIVVPVESVSYPTVKVTGLPSGLKYYEKETFVKAKGATPAYTIPANTIFGAPTAASKSDKNGNVTPSKVKVTVTTSGKSKAEYVIDLTVDPLPTWAVGEFSGLASTAEGRLGSASMSVTAAGKVSGKVIVNGTNCTFSAASYDITSTTVGETNLVAVVTGKLGKEAVTGGITVVASGATGTFAGAKMSLFRNVWKDKGAAPVPTEAQGLYTAKLVADDRGTGYLSLTVDKKGAVKVAGKAPDGTALSGSATLVPSDDGYFADVFCAPSAYKGGYVAGRLAWDADGKVSSDGLDWTSFNPQSTTDYYAGGFVRGLSASGARYVKDEMPKRLGVADVRLETPEGAELKTFSFAQSTGVWKGTLLWDFGDPLLNLVKVPFEGVLVLGEEALEGFGTYDVPESYIPYDKKGQPQKAKTYKVKESLPVRFSWE